MVLYKLDSKYLLKRCLVLLMSCGLFLMIASPSSATTSGVATPKGSPLLGPESTSLLSPIFDTSDKGTPEEQRTKIAQQIGDIINVILQFLGVLILLVIIYAGFLWLTAGGNEDQVKKAQAWIRNAVFGAIVIGAAYTLTALILTFTQ